MRPYKTKKCTYCDTNLPIHKFNCPVCGRGQPIAFAVFIPLLIVLIAAVVVIAYFIVPDYPKIETSENPAVSSSSSANNGQITDKKTESNNDASASSESSASSQGIKASKKLFGDVEITLPKELVDENATELTDEQKNSGFTKAEKLPDGSIKYTIKRKEYNKFIEDLRKQTASSLDELSTSDALTSIQGIKYNDDFSKITIIADKSAFSESFDSMAITTCGLASQLYQCFDVNAPQKVTVEVKDSTTNEVFQTETFPK